jgi:hypothetical protein
MTHFAAYRATRDLTRNALHAAGFRKIIPAGVAASGGVREARGAFVGAEGEPVLGMDLAV